MKRAIIAAAFVAGTTMMGVGTANAGVAGDTVSIGFTFFGGEDALAAANAAEIELFEDGVDVSALCSTGTPVGDATTATVTASCFGLSAGDYAIGAESVDGYVASAADCDTFGVIPADKELDIAGASFTHVAGQSHTCSIDLDVPPNVNVDVVVNGGDAAPEDFDIEIYEDLAGDPVATATDPAATTCPFADADAADCAVIALAPGSYFLGASEVAGYQLSSAFCEEEFIAVKPFDDPAVAFDHGDFGVDTSCTITMEFITQTVSADIEVINDDDGNALGDDFTIEFFDAAGNLVASGVDPEPGTGNASLEVELPIGEYRVGVEGPEGYDITVAITQVPVVTDVVGAETKPIEGDDALFVVSDELSAEAVVTADDQAAALPPPPTTVPDTMPPVTTTPPAPPTTIEPTTVLPATGSTTSGLIGLAFGLLFLGGGAVLATRRS